MKKGLMKFTKILVLIAMIFSDLMTPIKVFANEISSSSPIKGDVGINNEVTNNGNSATVSVGSIETEGGVKVTKTVSKTDTEGRYEIEFKIEGKDVKTSTEVNKPVYAVVIFDRSGSMASTKECTKYEYGMFGIPSCAEWKSDQKWESAVQGAKDFANTLLKKIPTANIALVAFSGNSDYDYDYWGNEYLKTGANKNDDAAVLRNFSNTNLDSSNFGSANGGTNLHAGLYEANKLLNASSIPSDAYKYVVVISDGQPTFYYDSNGYTKGEGDSTNTDTYNATIKMASTVKNNTKAEVFSIGYMLPSGNVYGNKTAADILTEVATSDSTDSEVKHYVDANPEKVANAFNNIAEEIGTANAATGAVLTDNLGGQFTLTTDSEARSYVSDTITNITEDGTTLSFYVDINQDSETGWYDTNAGFKLEYTDYKGEKQTLECSENPQVYWVQNTYDYVVNYYKDSFESGNLIKSETRKAASGTVINVSNVDRDKYLPTGYEFNKVDPNSITVTNDGETKVINILYTIKKFSYEVNYYYDGVLDSSLTINKTDIPYGTSVNSKSYYLEDSAIREGYVLDTTNSDNSIYTITDNDVVIDIYYKKGEYGYTVNYYFNSTKGFDMSAEAIYGDKITAQSKWLSAEELSTLNKSDYFLDPNKSTENNKEITIGTDTSKNVLDIYYINTNLDNTTEEIIKTSNINKVTGTDNKVEYTVNYNTSINNVKANDKVVVTIVDTLPGSIIESESTLNGGEYDSENNTITWVFTYDISEFKNVYTVSEEIEYTVLYENYVDFNGSDITNTAFGSTKVVRDNNEVVVTPGDEGTATTEVEIKGLVEVYYRDNDGNEIADMDSLGEELAGTDYTTTAKDIFGYTLNEERLPDNASGKYTEETIIVTYYYDKNDGTIENASTEKEGPNAINSVDGKFDYVINSKASIKYYVGDATLTVKDVLPYTINEENSDIDSRCAYDGNKTITCVVEYENIDEEDYTDGVFEVNETFNLSLTFIDVNTEKVVNKAESTIDLDGNKKTTEDEIETEVYKGTVKATYTVDSVDGDKLCEDVTTTGLAGTDYTTENKSFYGYTLKEVTGSNREGVYQANTTLVVSYIYTKNVGDVTENEVSKIQTNIITDIDSEYHYVLSYSGKVEDYAGEVTLELTDTLPYNAIIISKDAKCSVNGRTITCSDVYTVDKEHQIINAKFDIVLKYTTVGSEVKNVVNSKLIYGNNHVTDSAEVTDEVPSGTVNVYYEDNDGNEIADMDSLGEKLVGTEYNTIAKDVFGYTLDGDKLPDNASGKYINGNIEVIYYYTKNAGEIDEPSTKKTGPETIESVNGVFEYKITASGKVKDYVGDVTLTVKDILPYAIDTEKSVLDDRCVYEASANTITCTVEYNNINKEDYTDGVFEVNETFNLSLVFVDVDSEEVINKAESTIDLDGNKKTTDDETETEVYKGTVVATYKDTLGNTLCDDETTTGLVGTDYTTEEKEFFGYSLVEVKGNKEGIYSKDTIYVDYVYTKTTGTGDIEELPPQTGVEVNNFNNYLLILMMLMIIVKGYRSLKETL